MLSVYVFIMFIYLCFLTFLYFIYINTFNLFGSYDNFLRTERIDPDSEVYSCTLTLFLYCLVKTCSKLPYINNIFHVTSLFTYFVKFNKLKIFLFSGFRSKSLVSRRKSISRKFSTTSLGSR